MLKVNTRNFFSVTFLNFRTKMRDAFLNKRDIMNMCQKHCFRAGMSCRYDYCQF